MKQICGVDEVGRGPLAGPVVAAAAVFPEGYRNPNIRDSKQLSAKKRDYLIEVIRAEALAWKIIAVGHTRIDRLNILQATRLAMKLAVERLPLRPDLVLVDGNVPIDIPHPQRTVVKGDSLHVEISAASILAKVWRDHLMEVLDTKYPGYGLAGHAGYPTASHRAALLALGPSRIHRHSFRGVLAMGSEGPETRAA